MTLKYLFFRKIAQRLDGFNPQTPTASRPPSVISLTYTSLLNTFPNLDISPSVQQNPGYMPNQATASDLPFYDIFVPQKDTAMVVRNGELAN